MTSATISMTPNVTRYCTSLTANVKRGGTKKKSNSSTFKHGRQHRRPAAEPQARDVDAEQVDHHEIRQLEVRIHAERDGRAGGRDRGSRRHSASSAIGCAYSRGRSERRRRPATARRSRRS